MSEMSIQDFEQTGSRELDFHESDGISVALLWYEADGHLSVVVEDAKEERAFELPATPENARQIFQHPYAYIGSGELAVASSFEQAA